MSARSHIIPQWPKALWRWGSLGIAGGAAMVACAMAETTGLPGQGKATDRTTQSELTAPAAFGVERSPTLGGARDRDPALVAAPDRFDGLTRGEALALWNEINGDAYPFDSVDRFSDDPQGKLECDPTRMVSYAGSTVKYWGPVRVNEPFAERLGRFEQIIAEVGIEVYGRPPHRIRHMGAYSCRKSRNRSHRVSEHALGNAIDIDGFDFGSATKDQPLVEGLPKHLRGPFQVRVQKHWEREGSPATEAHARFLREVTERLRARRDVFRILIGPSHRGHSNHFHFDMSPWRYVNL